MRIQLVEFSGGSTGEDRWAFLRLPQGRYIVLNCVRGNPFVSKVAVLIDGGYLGTILKKNFKEPMIDHEKLARWACRGEDLFRAYYYDCLPYQSRTPTPDERLMMSRKQSFFKYLNRLQRFEVREGRLELRGVDNRGSRIFQQKRVDLQIGLDIATLVFRDGHVSSSGVKTST